MNTITRNQLIKIKTLMSKKGLIDYSAEMAQSFTDGRTTSVSKMHGYEALQLIQHLEEDNGGQATPTVKMQRKILSLAHEQGWKLPSGKINMERVNNWAIKYGYLHKPFNDYAVEELPALVTQFEKMYTKHLKGV